MLPTKGLFTNVDCPYYENTCDRPYCHFKHRKKNRDFEQVQAPSGAPADMPTYNPTPKSQLTARHHIPISYVPDLATKTDRSRLRTFNYGGSDVLPTYKPTPISILSKTSKLSNSLLRDKLQTVFKNDSDVNIPSYEPAGPEVTPSIEYKPTATNDTKYEPARLQATVSVEYKPTSTNIDANDINFEDLSTEFDMIDEIISGSGTEDVACNEIVRNKKEQTKSENRSKSHSSSKSKSDSNSKNQICRNNKQESKLHDSKNKTKESGHERSKKNATSSSKHAKEERNINTCKKEQINSKNDSKEKTHSSKDKSKHDHKSKYKDKDKYKDRDKNKEMINKRNDNRRKHESHDKHVKKKHKDDKRISDAKDNKEKKKAIVHKPKVPKLIDIFDNNIDSDDYETQVDAFEESDLEEDDTIRECYKIFNEYKPTEPQIVPLEVSKQETTVHEDTANSHARKRIAHEKAAEQYVPKIVHTKQKTAPNPAQAMVNRMKLARLAQGNNEQHNIINEINRFSCKRTVDISSSCSNPAPKLQKIARNSDVTTRKTKDAPASTSVPLSCTKATTSSYSLLDDIISGKTLNAKPKRIAPVQNINLIQRAKEKIDEMTRQKAAAMVNKTTAQTFGKHEKRVAHVPEFTVSDLPDVLEAERSKFPVNVRSRYLAMLAEECLKLYLTKEDGYQRALNEELKCYERCFAIVTYRNSAMLALNRLRKENQERDNSGLGPLLPNDSSRNSRNNDSELKGRRFYENVKQYVLEEEELILHGYPREGALPGHAVIKAQKTISHGHLEPNERLCCRCSKIYLVDKVGLALYPEECIYHPLKKRTLRGERMYLCCRSSEDTGCATSNTHVSDCKNVTVADLEGYQTIMPPETDDDPRSFAVYALDCEMCYTTKGLELTRVTIVNSELKTVYESLVKPLNPIIDYNTRFSGITKEQMERTATNIIQVQANILHLCNSKTVLIGHSLESDMKALKIIHSTIVDTSVLFPHKFGLPHKRALRALASEYLKKIIQNDVSGHDSAEDALSCMELIIWKLREELKIRVKS